MKIDLENITIKKAHEHLVNGDFSARELAEAYLGRIKERDKELNVYLEVYEDVLEQADNAQKIIDTEKDKSDMLTGIPIAIKDNILIEGRRVSCASKILEGYTAVYDAWVIKKLKDRNVVFIGRTNMDEFAMGSSNEFSAFGRVKNPHDTARVPGGSSGGSAAAVADNLALGAFGSDTGGSVRQPASFCGIVGLKPTYGAVSRSGLIAMASSFDQIGPLAKTVEDTKFLFEAIAGYDSMDSTSYNDTQRAYYDLKNVKSKMKIGVPYHLLEDKKSMDKDVLENFNNSLELLKNAGYEIKNIELPNTKYALDVYYIIMPAEASTNLARFDGVRYGLHKSGENLLDDYMETRREGFGEEVRRRIILGTHILSSGYYDAYYNKAVAVKKQIEQELENSFSDVELIAMPTGATPAFKLGERMNNPLAMYLSDMFTVTANIAGIPAISIPSGNVERDGKMLPVGFQLMAPHFGENILFKLGSELEELLLDDLSAQG